MDGNWRIKKSDFFFFIAYILFLFYKIIATSVFNDILSFSILRIIKTISWSMFFVKIILCNRVNLKLMISYMAFLILGLIIRINSGSSEIIELILVIIAAGDIEFKDIAKVTIIETVVLCLIITISSCIGFIPNYLFIRSNGTYGMALGFIYVGKLSNYFLQVMFLQLYLCEQKGKIASAGKLIMCFVISSLIFFISYVRNAYFISIVMIMLYVLIIKKKIFQIKKFKWVASLSFLISFFLTFYLVTNYQHGNEIFKTLNKIMSNRLQVMNRVFNSYKCTPFGNKIVMNGFNVINEKYTYVDSGYISILLRDGYLIMALISLSYTFLIKSNIENGSMVLVIWLILIAISSIVDDSLIQINFNCSILILFNTLKNKNFKFSRNEREKNGEKIHNSSSCCYLQ